MKRTHRLFVIAATAAILPLGPAAAQTSAAAPPEVNSFYPANKKPLPPSAYSILPLGAVMPQGWLKQQLTIQAKGLTGNLPKFWKDLGPDNGWLGGKGESWERGPYYMDGMVPLAFLTQDPELLEMAEKWVGWTLDNPRPDGAIGPVSCKDWWPLGLMCKTLTQYYDATGDARVIPVMTRFFAYMKTELPQRPLFEWAKMRWADTALSAIWLYNRTGDPELLEVSKLLMSQGHDYAQQFSNFEPYSKASPNWNFENHGVNAGMAYKTPGIMFQLTGDEKFKKAVYDGIRNLDKYHGQAGGTFAADECFAGTSPTQGTELCSVDESMFSFENLMAMFGDPLMGDKLERMSYNAWPATFSPDMWAHQYDQQANQVVCRIAEDRIYVNNFADSNIFGLEPNYGCCTSNMHQGWPKFAAHLWMGTPDGGLAAIAYAPCEVNAQVGGRPVRVVVQTGYPFRETIRIEVQAGAGARFPLALRVPAWAGQATVHLGDNAPERLEPGAYHRIEREWAGNTIVTLQLPMDVRLQRRYHNSVALERGPLVYSLKVGDEWRAVRDDPPHSDWEVYPTTPWNYAMRLDLDHPERSVQFEERPVGDCPFSPDGAPVWATAQGRLLPMWVLEHNAAGPLPDSPAESDAPLEALTLIPYGCTNLRVTEFPVLSSTLPPASDPRSAAGTRATAS